ncbi:MAG: hypothetical protein Q8K82_10940 [Gemmatimonadaceae bacterium]|nr:hypothetical protein [Gemmatimonadaceae bacterium]
MPVIRENEIRSIAIPPLGAGAVRRRWRSERFRFVNAGGYAAGKAAD